MKQIRLRWQPRISLMGLLLLTTAVASVLFGWRAEKERAAVERENATLRDRLVGLDYTDAYFGHARLVRHDESPPKVFIWQIYTPTDIKSQLVIDCGPKKQTLPLPGGVCSVQFECVPSADEWLYKLRIEPSAFGDSGNYPVNWEASGNAELRSSRAPPWLRDGLSNAQLECLGAWPLQKGTFGSEERLDVMNKQWLLRSWTRGKRKNLGIELRVEPSLNESKDKRTEQ